jgi:hypothetical protein
MVCTDNQWGSPKGLQINGSKSLHDPMSEGEGQSVGKKATHNKAKPARFKSQFSNLLKPVYIIKQKLTVHREPTKISRRAPL